MTATKRTIEVEAEVAELLEARAAARGMNVSALLADIASNENALPEDLARMRAEGSGPWSPAALEEDARRLAEFERARAGVPWQEVEVWLKSWGTPDELPPPQPRKL